MRKSNCSTRERNHVLRDCHRLATDIHCQKSPVMPDRLREAVAMAREPATIDHDAVTIVRGVVAMRFEAAKMVREAVVKSGAGMLTQ